MTRIYYFIILLSFSSSLLSGAVSAQLSVPRVEQAVQVEDDNPNDTVLLSLRDVVAAAAEARSPAAAALPGGWAAACAAAEAA